MAAPVAQTDRTNGRTSAQRAPFVLRTRVGDAGPITYLLNAELFALQRMESTLAATNAAGDSGDDQRGFSMRGRSAGAALAEQFSAWHNLSANPPEPRRDLGPLPTYPSQPESSTR
ncbi:hypothetical protein AB0C34_17710 [Nocardia sp. NPDC049220]|uniref:hypothetical protein n=1 Tax=Nocardia sp. NPDC049220 TaxID=3155273 RepID=UPI0033EDB098